MPRIRYRLDRTIDHLRRYEHILAVLVKYGFEEVADAVRSKLSWRGRRAPEVKPVAGRHSRPERLRLALQELGPTFIKFGQLLSARPDLLPAEYVQQLTQLQDHVTPVPRKDIRRQIERQLGGRLEEFFPQFEPKCIAAGSIAQVHLAVTSEGQKVAVKVRRPGITETLRTECEILEDIAGVIKSMLSEHEPLDPVRMVQEFTRAVSREVDLANELRNLQRFARNFADEQTVHIPEVYPEYCSEGVLTMEYIEGLKPSSLEVVRQVWTDRPSSAGARTSYCARSSNSDCSTVTRTRAIF